MPETATELTYWGYIAAVSIWGNSHRLIGDYALIMGGLGVVSVLLGAGLALLLLWPNGPRRLAAVYRARLQQKIWIPVAGYLALVCAFTAALPGFALVISALVVALPLPGHSAGVHVAEKAIASYQVSLKSGSARCVKLVSPAGPLGQCPMIIAQTKERIAFLDGDQVHIASMQDLRISFHLK